MPADRQTNTHKDRSGVFISYARSDGEAFALRLRQQLEKQKVELWQDRVKLEGGRDWWLQITEALNQVQFMALVVTPNALKSEVVRKEWRYARQQGVCVYPIKGAANLDFNSLPRWMRDQHFYDLGTLEKDNFGPEWHKFLNDLNKTPDLRRVPFMVEDLGVFVERPGQFDPLVKLLLDEKREEPIAITAALQGAGGYGKTTLAKALCHDERIQDAFDDGILWVTLSENPGDLTRRVEDLIFTLSGDRPGFTGVDAAANHLKELLADRDILLVIDDVWNNANLRPFLQGGERCARLITTRNLDTLPPTAQKVRVDAMEESEAVAMLLAGINPLPPQDRQVMDGTLRGLMKRLGEWPLLLKLVSGAMRERIENANASFAEAISYVNRALDKRGLTHFDARNPDDRGQAVEKTIGVSLELLAEAEHARYAELAIFPEDVSIPLPTLEKYWGQTGGFDEFDTDDLCTKLNRLSLLLSYDVSNKRVLLHDVIRTYLIEKQKERLPSLHNQLLDAHAVRAWSEMAKTEPYLWDHLAFHLVEAGRGQELVATVKDWRYLAKKTLLRKSHLVESDLLKAQAIAPDDDPLRALGRGVAGASHLFNHCQTSSEIEATIYSRLQHLGELKTMLADLAQSLDCLNLVVNEKASLPDLPHPALIRTLQGHSASVWGCAFSPDGKLIVSASDYETLKVWDAMTGQALTTFYAERGMLCCAMCGEQIVAGGERGVYFLRLVR